MAIEREFQNRIVNNEVYSREYLFRVSEIGNHSLGITFIPTSESYNRYGSNINVSILYTEEELMEMIENYGSKPPINSFGIVKAKLTVQDKTDEQIEMLASDGFDTRDILTILHF